MLRDDQIADPLGLIFITIFWIPCQSTEWDCLDSVSSTEWDFGNSCRYADVPDIIFLPSSFYQDSGLQEWISANSMAVC